MLAPAVAFTGASSVAAGANGGVPGAAIASFSGTPVFGGGGGGGSFDHGGNSGSSLFAPDPPPAPSGMITLTAPTAAAAAGFIEVTLVDPTALF
jgi:hypothetical protein